MENNTPATPVEASKAPAVSILTGTDANLRPKETTVPQGEQKAAPAGEAAKKWALKFGENDTEEVDEETLLKYAQKYRGADKVFQSAAAQRKEVENVIRALKETPGKAILNKALGHTPKAVLEQVIKEAMEEGYDLKDIKDFLAEQMYGWIQEENLDPKEKENRELKKRLEKLEASKKVEEEAKQKEITDKMTQEFAQKFTNDITEVLKSSGLPKTTFTVKRMAYWLDQAYRVKSELKTQGQEMPEPTAKDVLDLVRKDYEVSIKELYGQADAETLIKLIGEDGINKIRKLDVERLKAPKAQPTQSVSKKTETKSEPKVAKVKTSKNFFKQREEEIRNMEKGI